MLSITEMESIMRRFTPPYNGKRYVLNRNTHEVHDLDRETSSCRINEIKSDHVYNCDSYLDAQMYSMMLDSSPCNGCAYCMPEKNNG
ncbi:MAG: hypothetical protein ACOCNL_14340 [Acetivibrio ethanolgignens]